MAIIEDGIATNSEMYENGCKKINQKLFDTFNYPYNINEIDKCPPFEEIVNKFFNVRFEVEDFNEKQLIPFNDLGIRPTIEIPFVINNPSGSYYRFEGLEYVITYNKTDNFVDKSNLMSVVYPPLINSYTNNHGNISTNCYLDNGARIDFYTGNLKCYIADDEFGTNSRETTCVLLPSFYENDNNDDLGVGRVGPTLTIGQTDTGSTEPSEEWVSVTLRTNNLQEDYDYFLTPLWLNLEINGEISKISTSIYGSAAPATNDSYLYWSFLAKRDDVVRWYFSPSITQNGLPVLATVYLKGGVTVENPLCWNFVAPLTSQNILLPVDRNNITFTIDCTLENANTD